MNNKPSTLTARPPVVVVMGHIDHGKSTLLDYIRKTNITAGEAGGITQAVGAYEVLHQTAEGAKEPLTFIDTPGHEAFIAMRSRGAQMADIGVLVVAADDGVKPQTLESLKIIQEQKLPFIVAINKIDKPNTRPELVKEQLAEQQVFLEGYGGTIPAVNLSAKTGEGVPELLDLIVLTAQLSELTGEPAQPASGYVLEATVEARSGSRATVIIKNGTLRTGTWIVVGGAVSKVKQLQNFRGENVSELSFSSPAVVFGWSDRPEIGASFQTFTDKQAAEDQVRAATAGQPVPPGSIKTPPASIADESVFFLPIIIKTDVAGTIEAVQREIKKLETERVRLRVLATGVGTITENDVKLAVADDKSLILGFNVKIERSTLATAERFGITVVTFPIIYQLSEWLAEEIKRREPKTVEETIVGVATIIKIFSRDKDKQVVGGAVKEGQLINGRTVRLVRRGSMIGQGKIIELQQQKLATKEISAGNQFGMMIESKMTIAPGDTLEVIEK